MTKEPAAKKTFEGIVPRSFFTLDSEVLGTPNNLKPIKRLYREWGNTSKTSYKIDYVLRPTAKLLDAGWELGAIGVEVKAGPLVGNPLKKPGRVISQLLDYQCAEFCLSDGKLVPLSMVFLFVFPYERFSGLFASVMMQEGIGVVKGYRNAPESFKLVHGNCMHPILEIIDGVPAYKRPRFGYALGSR